MEFAEIVEKLKQDLPREEVLELLGFLTDFPAERAVEVVLDYLDHEDYLIKSRAFVVLEKLAHPLALPPMFRILREEPEEEFRLRALAVIQAVGHPQAIPELEKVLQDWNPYLIRGALVALGSIGGEEAARVILEFASSPRGRIVRRELVQEALAFCLLKVSEKEKFLARLAEANGGIRRYLRGLNLEAPPISHFSVYPSNDYLRLKCEARGVDYKTYKRKVVKGFE